MNNSKYEEYERIGSHNGQEYRLKLTMMVNGGWIWTLYDDSKCLGVVEYHLDLPSIVDHSALWLVDLAEELWRAEVISEAEEDDATKDIPQHDRSITVSWLHNRRDRAYKLGEYKQ